MTPHIAVSGACVPFPIFKKEREMAKGQVKGNKEARKPKKTAPPKPNASQPSLKGFTATALKK